MDANFGKLAGSFGKLTFFHLLEDAPCISLTFGNFGSACNEVILASGGIENYNLEVNYMDGMFKAFGVVSYDGKHIYTFGFGSSEKLDYLE